jgi:hypothetical protein
MRPLLRMLCVVLPVLLVSCGGGGNVSGPAPAAEQPAIGVAAGTFYRQDGIVVLGQTVTANASLPAGSAPSWRMAQAPTFAPAAQLATALNQASFVASAPGTYRLELSASSSAGTSAPVSATFTVVPLQIEYEVEVTHSGGTTTIEVHGGAANVPMVGCLVYSGTGCTLPTSVEATLDGVSLGALTTPNAGGPAQPAYRFAVPTASLGTAQHALRVDVHGPMRSFGGRVREGFLLFDASKTAQLGVFGIEPTDVGSDVAVLQAVPTTYGPRVGDRLTATGSISGLRAGMTFAATLRLVERPAGSAAALGAPQAANPLQAAADLLADKPGRYTVEFVPVLSDGGTTPPVYATAVVRPHELFFTVLASSQAPDEQPLAPDSDRIAVQVTSDRNPEQSTVSLFLDGTLVGTLAAPNVIRIVPTPGWLGMGHGEPRYAFDIPNAQLGTATHIARVVVVDATGQAHEGSLAFAAGADAEGGFGPFEDPNP